MLDEKELIKECKRFNPTAQRIVFSTYGPKLFAACMRYGFYRDDVDDILQEAFLKIFKKIKDYKGKGSFEAWMRRIVINMGLDIYRKKARFNKKYAIEDINEKENEVFDEQTIADEKYDRKEIDESKVNFSLIQEADFSKEELLFALEQLPMHYRIVFNMYSVDECTHAEIAKTLGVDETTSRSRLLRARKMLQQELYKMSIDKLCV